MFCDIEAHPKFLPCGPSYKMCDYLYADAKSAKNTLSCFDDDDNNNNNNNNNNDNNNNKSHIHSNHFICTVIA